MPTSKLKIAALLWLAFLGAARAETPEEDDKAGPAAVAPAVAPVPPPVSTAPAARVRRAPPPHMGYNFDWDDNIMVMKTTIIAFRKGTDGTKPEDRMEFSTGKWAEVRNIIGQPGHGYEAWEQRQLDPKGSYENFFDQRGRNTFLDQVNDAMSGDPSTWKGPSWDAFVAACSRRETAMNVTIITARGHSPYKMWLALKELQRRGLINWVPPQRNIRPVGNPNFYAGSKETSERKAIYMEEFLDEFQKRKVRGEADVLNQDGTGRQRLHLWGFSDDDYSNFTKAKEAFAKAMREKPGRWSNIKITLFYTGTKKEGVQPHAVVLMSNGEARPATPQELLESEGLLEGYPCTKPYRGVAPRPLQN